MPARKKGDETGETRGSIPIALSPEANAIVNRWLDRSGGWGKSKFVGTLIERFAAMPESVQQIMMGSVADDLKEEYAKRATEFFQQVVESGEWPKVPGERLKGAVVGRVRGT